MTRMLFSAAAIVALVSSPALSADLRRPVEKAPPLAAPVYSWTGCYIKGGGGYGFSNSDDVTLDGGVAATSVVTSGGRGWFGTVGGGCDYQFGQRWVVGVYGDYDFADIKGDFSPPGFDLVGEEKLRSAWAVAGRIGYLITPSVLTFVSGGYTQARFDDVNFVESVSPFGPTTASLSGQTYSGWFVGSGFEYNLEWFPGLFWRSEYRYAQYDNKTRAILDAGVPSAFSVDSEKFVQTIRSEVVWRFNWGGPVRAGY